MHQVERLPGRGRSLRASLLTALAVAAVPGVFFLFAYRAFISPQWDSSDDSGAVQGFFVLGVSSALAVMFALVGFPTAAHLLGEKFTRLRFFGVLLAFLTVLAIGTGLAVAAALGDVRMATAFGLLFLAAAGILCLPFAWLWTHLAKKDA